MKQSKHSLGVKPVGWVVLPVPVLERIGVGGDTNKLSIRSVSGYRNGCRSWAADFVVFFIY